VPGRSARPVPAAVRGAARMRRQPGGRGHQVKVRLNDAEYAATAARAAGARVSMQRLLVEAALAGDAATASERRALVAELLAARRLVLAMGNNLNQLARVANSTGFVRPEVSAAAAAAARAVQRLEDAAHAIAPGRNPRRAAAVERAR
jgi:Bacterial mobilisation protein (MobC)